MGTDHKILFIDHIIQNISVLPPDQARQHAVRPYNGANSPHTSSAAAFSQNHPYNAWRNYTSDTPSYLSSLYKESSSNFIKPILN